MCFKSTVGGILLALEEGSFVFAGLGASLCKLPQSCQSSVAAPESTLKFQVPVPYTPQTGFYAFGQCVQGC